MELESRGTEECRQILNGTGITSNWRVPTNIKWNWNHGELKSSHKYQMELESRGKKSADKYQMKLESRGTEECPQISNGTRITGNWKVSTNIKWNWNRGELNSAHKYQMELESRRTEGCRQILNGTRITGNWRVPTNIKWNWNHEELKSADKY